MENIDIKGYTGDYFIPSAKFNSETGYCLLDGESYLEDTMEFYAPLLLWLEEFTKNTDKPIHFDFKLNYFNTSSSKRLLDILLILRDYQRTGGKVAANWFFDEEDPDIEEDVDDFIIISEINIKKHFG